jgi:hypothetical protein
MSQNIENQNNIPNFINLENAPSKEDQPDKLRFISKKRKRALGRKINNPKAAKQKLENENEMEIDDEDNDLKADSDFVDINFTEPNVLADNSAKPIEGKLYYILPKNLSINSYSIKY